MRARTQAGEEEEYTWMGWDGSGGGQAGQWWWRQVTETEWSLKWVGGGKDKGKGSARS